MTDTDKDMDGLATRLERLKNPMPLLDVAALANQVLKLKTENQKLAQQLTELLTEKINLDAEVRRLKGG
jgi:regulator of replication initiation timing